CGKIDFILCGKIDCGLCYGLGVDKTHSREHREKNFPHSVLSQVLCGDIDLGYAPSKYF
ncbi:MAG: hypothetical protein K940chlam9_01549, partial [Chlamydiae bacterium]|nr:hypothetical protein [Chlamydiota bacterium]